MSKPFVLSPDLQQAVASFFQRIPFNQMLGIELDELSHERVTMHLPMKPELIGNFVHGILHGGVISSLLDVCGGAMALIGAFANHQHLPVAERMSKLSKLGTIGSDHDTAAALTQMGAEHHECEVSDIIEDSQRKLVTTPAYMLAQSIAEAASGINKLVDRVLELAHL